MLLFIALEPDSGHDDKEQGAFANNSVPLYEPLACVWCLFLGFFHVLNLNSLSGPLAISFISQSLFKTHSY